MAPTKCCFDQIILYGHELKKINVFLSYFLKRLK